MKVSSAFNSPVNPHLNVQVQITSCRVSIPTPHLPLATIKQEHQLTIQPPPADIDDADDNDGFALVQASNFTTLFVLSREQNPSRNRINVCIPFASFSSFLFNMPHHQGNKILTSVLTELVESCRPTRNEPR